MKFPGGYQLANRLIVSGWYPVRIPLVPYAVIYWRRGTLGCGRFRVLRGAANAHLKGVQHECHN